MCYALSEKKEATGNYKLLIRFCFILCLHKPDIKEKFRQNINDENLI